MKYFVGRKYRHKTREKEGEINIVLDLPLSLTDLEREREGEKTIVLALLQKFSRIDAAFVTLKQQNIHDIMTDRSTPEKIRRLSVA